LEQKTFGFTHGQIGAQLLRRWGLPEDMVNAVENHYGTEDPEKTTPLSMIVVGVNLAAFSLRTIFSDKFVWLGVLARNILVPAIFIVLLGLLPIDPVARMAILIRDFGFAADKTTVDYLSFPEPLTVALIPSRKLSSWTAQIANEYKKEIVVLLPMEPVMSRSSLAGAPLLMIHYPDVKVRSIIAGAAAGGLVLGGLIGAALAPPVYYAPPPPVYYYPPAPRAYYYAPPVPRAYVYPY